MAATQLTRESLETFNFFAFAPVGLLILSVSNAFIALSGRKLLSVVNTVMLVAVAASSGDEPHTPLRRTGP